MQIFICGSHTDVGKTCVSAALCHSFNLDYFKLIQAGMPMDCQKIQKLCPKTNLFPNGITLKHPISPHLAMEMESITYKGLEIPLPPSKNLLIETAGGLFSPLDQNCCMIDYLTHKKLPTILVGKYYLGGINHILLSIKALEYYHIPLLGLIISGTQNQKIDDFIKSYIKIKIAHCKTFHTHEEFLQNAEALKKEMQEEHILYDSMFNY